MWMIFSMAIFRSILFGDNWTVGVGGNPSRNSLSQEHGPQADVLIWGEGLTSVIAQQAVIEENIVAMARMHNLNDVLHGTRIVGHDLGTGDTLWTAELPVDFPATDWRSRVSAIRDGQVYATRAGNTNASYLYALNATTGAIVWQSEDLITETSTEGATFADDGDVITTGVNSVIRIDGVNGLTVWETDRTCPTSGGCDPVVSGNRVYLWEAGVAGPVITAFDLDSGARLFSSEGIGGGFVQQVAPFVGPDGTVYAPRTQNNPITDFLVALQDTGSGFKEKWRVPLGYVPFASFGVGPDGSVYSYSRTYRVIRLEPSSGTIMDSSEVMVSDFYQPRMAIGSKSGSVFVTNGGFSQGGLSVLNSNLSLSWSVSIPNVNVGGPAIGQGGALIVCGTGTDVRMYRTPDPLSVDQVVDAGLPDSPYLAQNYPNPFNGTSNIEFEIPAVSEVSLAIFDLLGREVAVLVSGDLQPGVYRRRWESSDLPSGTYFYRLSVAQADGEAYSQTRRMILIR